MRLSCRLFHANSIGSLADARKLAKASLPPASFPLITFQGYWLAVRPFSTIAGDIRSESLSSEWAVKPLDLEGLGP